MKLVAMTDADYAFWLARSLKNYREEKMKANGLTEAEAEAIAQGSFRRLLPKGLQSGDNYLFSIRDNSEVHGYLWFAVQGALDNRKAFLYDIIIEDTSRGKGVGRKAMTLLEEEVRKLGLKSIGLHVFGHNQVAISLYQSLGYLTTDINMEKTL